MRIISGKYKGQQLVSFQADHIRPTTDRVKETLFNKLMGYFEEAQVVDLFCGTGNLGLEALSRGAAHVTFVDVNKKSLDITRRNLEKLKVPSEQFQMILGDVIRYLKNYSGTTKDVILIDPPFTEKMADEVLKALSNSKILSGNSIIAIESGLKEKIEEQYGDLHRFDAREYGDKTLSLFHKKTDN